MILLTLFLGLIMNINETLNLNNEFCLFQAPDNDFVNDVLLNRLRDDDKDVVKAALESGSVSILEVLSKYLQQLKSMKWSLLKIKLCGTLVNENHLPKCKSREFTLASHCAMFKIRQRPTLDAVPCVFLIRLY